MEDDEDLQPVQRGERSLETSRTTTADCRAGSRAAHLPGETIMATATFRGRRCAYEPDYAVPPGHTLQETIDAMGIDQRELVQRTGLSAKHVNQVINRKSKARP